MVKKYFYKRIVKNLQGHQKTQYYYLKGMSKASRTNLKYRLATDIQKNINRVDVSSNIKQFIKETRKPLLSLKKLRQFARTTSQWDAKKASAYVNYLYRTQAVTKYQPSKSVFKKAISEPTDEFNRAKYGTIPKWMREHGASDRQIRQFQRSYSFVNYLDKPWEKYEPSSPFAETEETRMHREEQNKLKQEEWIADVVSQFSSFHILE